MKFVMIFASGLLLSFSHLFGMDQTNTVKHLLLVLNTIQVHTIKPTQRKISPSFPRQMNQQTYTKPSLNKKNGPHLKFKKINR